MSLIFNKMLVRFTALAISVLYFQVSCSQQNGSNILSNLVLNNSVGIQSQGNIIQKSLNQFATNRVLANNLQQTVNLQKSQNLQSQGSQHGANVQQLVNLQTLNNQQPSNLQTVSTQHPINLQSVTTQKPMRLQSPMSNTQQSRNFQSGHAHQPLSLQTGTTKQPLNLQQSLNIQPIGNIQSLSLQQPINIQQTSLPNRNGLQQNINIQNQNPSLNNVQILGHVPDVSSAPKSGQYVQTCTGANVPSSSTTPTIPGSTTTLCINNSGGESVSVMNPQNQQVSISGFPSYVIDSTQISKTVQAPMVYSTAQGNQPALLTILAVPQQNHQPIETVQSPVKSVQSKAETPNQITIVKSVQPHSSAASTANQNLNQISVLSPTTNQVPPSSYSAILPTVSSILASSLSKQASKSSNLKALLPLIFNLIKERNSCGCNQHCGCSKNTHNLYDEEGDEYRSFPKQSRYSYKQGHSKYSNDYSEEFEDHGPYINRRNSKKYGKHKSVKPESVEISNEYDYSDEFHEDD